MAYVCAVVCCGIGGWRSVTKPCVASVKTSWRHLRRDRQHLDGAASSLVGVKRYQYRCIKRMVVFLW